MNIEDRIKRIEDALKGFRPEHDETYFEIALCDHEWEAGYPTVQDNSKTVKEIKQTFGEPYVFCRKCGLRRKK